MRPRIRSAVNHQEQEHNELTEEIDSLVLLLRKRLNRDPLTAQTYPDVLKCLRLTARQLKALLRGLDGPHKPVRKHLARRGVT